MPLSLVITRDVADRFRGFLASCLLEVAPGVYLSLDLDAGVRDRIWAVLKDWFQQKPGSSIIQLWNEKALPSGLGMRFLGEPPKELIEYDGLWLVRRDTANL